MLRRLIPGTWPSGADPRAAYPTLDEICATGAYYLPQDRHLVRRHVETVRFLDESRAKRRLTVDIALPRDPEAAIAASEDGYRFYVPIALMRKSPPTSNIDLVDETGRALPLLTRDQNARLTHAAVKDLAEQLLGGAISPEMDAALRIVVQDDGLKAVFAMEYALVAAEEEPPGQLAGAEKDLFEHVLLDFTRNSLLWCGLSGRPGARKLVKLRYDIPVELPPLPRRPPAIMQVTVETENAVHEFEYEDPGDGHHGSTLARLWRRITHTFGGSPIELSVDSPYTRGCDSYHMQVEAPAGLETRSIELADPPAPEAPERYVTRTNRETAHLYMTGTAVGPISAPVIVRMGAGRRGFMSLAFLSAFVTAVLLWAFKSDVEDLKEEGIAAAILLVVPGLLAALAVRQQEHALAARVLTGVRLMLLLSALCAVAAAAALAGLRPEAWSLEEAWRNYAIVASVIGVVLAVNWLLSFRVSWRLADRLGQRLEAPGGYFFATFSVGLLVGALALDAVQHPELALDREPFFAGLCGALLLLTLKLGGSGERVSYEGWVAAVPRLLAFAQVALLARLAGFDPLSISTHQAWQLLLYVAVCVAVLSAVRAVRQVRNPSGQGEISAS